MADFVVVEIVGHRGDLAERIDLGENIAPEVINVSIGVAQPVNDRFRVVGGVGIEPVSYTHLDVYKRQETCCWLIKFRP